MMLSFDRAIVTDKRIALSSENVQHRTFYQLNYSFKDSANKKQVAFQSFGRELLGKGEGG